MTIDDLCKKYPFSKSEILEAYRFLGKRVDSTDIVCSVAEKNGRKPIDYAPFIFESRCICEDVARIGMEIANGRMVEE